MLEAKLVVVGGDTKSSEVRLRLPTVVGRGRDAGLTVPHALVSRQHTEIFERDGKLFVRDLGSLNGTFVNNFRIEAEQELAPNQLLTIGNITFRAVYEVAAGVLDATENSETEVNVNKTDEIAPIVAPVVAMKRGVDKMVGAVDINETVLVEDFRIAKSSQAGAARSHQKVELEPVEIPVAAKANPAATSQPKPEPQPESKPASQDADPKVELDDKKKEPSSKDTDKSFKSAGVAAEKAQSNSGIFSFDEDAGQIAGKSASLSALGDFSPVAELPAGSFAGKVDLGEDAMPAASQIDRVEIDLGVENKPAEDDDDLGLESFLSKLPR